MKKSIFAMAAACAAAACLSACNMSCNDNNTPYDHYDAINTMFNASYSKIAVTVTTTLDSDMELTSTYNMTYSGDEVTVNYSIERFTDISFDNASVEKTVTTGVAKVKNGEIISDDKGMLDVVPETKFSFKKEYFSNVNEAVIDMFLQADVTNPSGFMGIKTPCTDMKINAEYFTVFNKMEITYKGQDGISVKIDYVFTA